MVAAPVLWMLADTIVTGEPLYSLTSTREVSGQFGRNRGLGDALRHLPRYSGGNDTIVTVGVGGMGLMLAVWLLRRRAALALALGGLGLLTFLIISAAGLSVIPRYMTIPSLLLSLCVAVALGGLDAGRARDDRPQGGHRRRRPVRAGHRLARAVLRLGLLHARPPGELRGVQHEQLERAQRDESEVAAALQACRPITVPTHAPIPILRYETGLPKEAIEASIQQDAPPTEGLQLASRVFNFEPSTGRAVAATPRVTVERLVHAPAAGFERIGRAGALGGVDAVAAELAPPAP